MDRFEVVAGLDPELLEYVVYRLRELEPSTVAVLVFGSYAKGTADEDSDLDVEVVTEGEPLVPYRTWFEERPGGKPLHVSPSVRSLAGWLAKRDEPQAWALGFPVEHVVRYVWSTDEARAKLGDPASNVHPAPGPELEDFVEFMMKLRRAAAHGDGLSVRVYAREAGMLIPGLLRTLNGEVAVRDRTEALDVALSLEVAPEHYGEDMPVCLGLVAAQDDEVREVALRLGQELLAFLRERNADVGTQPDIARYLADGTLERHLGFLTD